MSEANDPVSAIPAHPALRAVIKKDVLAALERYALLLRHNHTSAPEIEETTAALLCEMFVIYAEHHLALLSDRAQVTSYGPYLLHLIEKLTAWGESITAHWVPPLDPVSLLSRVKVAMVSRVPHYEAQASVAADRVAAARLKKKRAGIVRKYRKRKGLAIVSFQRHTHCSDTAIYGMINGDRTRYDEQHGRRWSGPARHRRPGDFRSHVRPRTRLMIPERCGRRSSGRPRD